ncbi:hypothetical protein DUNSADRAFT_9468 [Dunaliella salina]|uniref:SBNO alpha/beta domain-containing protein n=1 Tax=Dunaliella salina TaxID=3046 RepID=A0ABQ7GHE7_DUNSA|nr:hypothetical protein DUNSADRAFT_9468 [Dunaliella salina]|eukprot:KAF5834029.1 hypothetical protein DUNSADRAFT_9468 [Dunaliella salina]
MQSANRLEPAIQATLQARCKRKAVKAPPKRRRAAKCKWEEKEERKEQLFEYFASTLQASVRKAKSEEGMNYLNHVPVYLDKRMEIHRDLVTGASTHYVKLRVDDGLSWENAKELRDATREELISKGAPPGQLGKYGFYISRQNWRALNKPQIVLCTEAVAKAFSDTRFTKYQVRRPNQTSSAVWPEHDLLQRYRPLRNDEEAERLWKWWHTTLVTCCLHGPNCQVRNVKGHCETGSRIYHKHMVSGE